ncbi:MAG: hypothetical protein PHW60_16155, partial [Kiritimatiellae bacterium]|nr:hypothetical protein [Kiritimatiellia bacterium]
LGIVDYGAGREGVVETIRSGHTYGGRIEGLMNNAAKVAPFVCDFTYAYRDILRLVSTFFQGGATPVDMLTTFEGLAIMTSARQSIESGKAVKIPQLAE